MEILTAEQAIEAAKELNFEKVWAALMESRQLVDATQKQIDTTQKQIDKTQKQIDKTQKQVDKTQKQVDKTQKQVEKTQKQVDETSRQVKESQQYIDASTKNMDASIRNINASFENMNKIVSELTKNIGGIGNTLGTLTEAMFSADLWKKFSEIGFTFSRQGPHYKFFKNNRCLAEADYFLENGEFVMPVEVKTILEVEHVNDHLDRIEKIRHHMDARGDMRKIVGAVAGGSVHENVLKYAQKQGLYVIMQSGEATVIADAPAGFRAREWDCQNGISGPNLKEYN